MKRDLREKAENNPRSNVVDKTGFKRESREQPKVKCSGQDDGPTGKSDI